MGVNIEWFDKVIRKILKARDYQGLAQKVISLKEHMEVLQKRLDILAKELKEVKDEKIGQEMDPLAPIEQVVRFFDDSA